MVEGWTEGLKGGWEDEGDGGRLSGTGEWRLWVGELSLRALLNRAPVFRQRERRKERGTKERGDMV